MRLPVHDVQCFPFGAAIPEAIGVSFQLSSHFAALASKAGPDPHIWQRVHAPLHWHDKVTLCASIHLAVP